MICILHSLPFSFSDPQEHIISETSHACYTSCQSLPSQFCNLDVICHIPHFIAQCNALSTVVAQRMCFMQCLLFSNYKNYTYTYLFLGSGGVNILYFLWGKYSQWREIVISLPLQLCLFYFWWVSLQKNTIQITIKYTGVHIQKNSLIRRINNYHSH